MDKNLVKMIAFLLIMVLVCFLLYYLQSDSKKDTKITFLGIGKADSILIQSKSENILIDAGEKKHKERIIAKLKTLGVKKIDHIILTHPDKDHIGGASKVIESFDIGKIYQSSFNKGSKAQLRLDKVILEKHIDNIILKENLEIRVGSLTCTIYPSEKDDHKKSNDHSLVTLVKDKNLNYLFTGDAETKRLEEIYGTVLPKIDLLKMPHHGRVNENSVKIIEKLSPKYDVVTNYESQADKEIINALEEVKSNVFYADEEDIHFSSDGEKLVVD